MRIFATSLSDPGRGTIVPAQYNALAWEESVRRVVHYRSFGEFYPFYLSQHADRTCRRLHFVGTTLRLAASYAAGDAQFLVDRSPASLPDMLLPGSATSFREEPPATFTYPLYSFMGDWAMWKDMLTGRIRF